MIRSQNFWLVALFLSKFGDLNKANKSVPPQEVGGTLWKDAYQYFFNDLGEGRTTSSFEHSLKNARDAFDSHLKKSTRIGWKDLRGRAAILPKEALYVFKKYKNVERNDLWKEIQLSVLKTKNNNSLKTEQIASPSSKNPNWVRQELILALDLYFDLDQGQMHRSNEKVIALSDLLRKLSVHKHIPDIKKFRNPSGVARRLGNFKAMDSGYTGDGLSNSGKLAKIIFDEFRMHRGRLKEEAELIKQIANKAVEGKLAEPAVSYTSSKEQEFKYNYHKNLELNPLTFRVKKQSINNSELITCFLCKMNSQDVYGTLGSDLMELHYVGNIDETSLTSGFNPEDFILVCPNCHKLLDTYYAIITYDDLKNILSSK
ncbi:HNH endonuclease [Pedobacter heparinus]|uniref:Restriction endonuclease n=1 Tax=Pedobacter heparinus (strain ATCC 13125 / DSM 2366 / CIP 104194 / JCM 7457 / NBRC 12017 / NCIMB 9290 / NRRL B-14731 / HIM 762-3) TaxID=485917 RepID=C6Y2U2_PEDHD|nr:restriction endonuclease [Pedobacter heparinus]ACU03155.1 restriction endonuclease [Pedobacter heparinus DSM 2366]